MFYKKGVLRNFAKFTGTHLRQILFFNKVAGLKPATLLKKRPEACNFVKKETPALVFSCEFCEISKYTCFTEHLWATASDSTKVLFCTSGQNAWKIVNKIAHWLANKTPLQVLFKDFHRKCQIATLQDSFLLNTYLCRIPLAGCFLSLKKVGIKKLRKPIHSA